MAEASSGWYGTSEGGWSGLRYRGALALGKKHLNRREFFAAYDAFRRAAARADGERYELARGLAHLAAAGYRDLNDDPRGRARQLAHARRRLAPFGPQCEGLDLGALLRQVEGRPGAGAAPSG